MNEVVEDFFTITRERYSAKLGSVTDESERAFYNSCCNVFGKDIHVSGVTAEQGICLFVMRSRQEDDHSKPWLEATEEAAKQFSGKRPSFVGVQLNDIEASDLALPQVRRRAEILSGSLFHRKDTAHVAATFFTAYEGLVSSDDGIRAPAFSILNPAPKFIIERYEFAPLIGSNISDNEFSRLLRSGT